jgi:hypothetical protein
VPPERVRQVRALFIFRNGVALSNQRKNMPNNNPIKLKSLLPKTIQQKNTKPEKDGKKIFAEFVEIASSPQYKADKYWDELRTKLTPTKFKDVDAMFDRWQALAGIKK